MSTSDIFPPLAAYPLTREVRYTSRLNRLAGAVEYRATDAGPRLLWNVTLELTDAELAQVQAFYQARGGQYEAFSFLDPLDNLLRWSEDFSQAAWVKSDPANLHISGFTLANSGAGPNVVRQAVALPGVEVTGSVWLQAATAPITLRLTGGPERAVHPGPVWRRYTLTGTGTGFELEIPADAGVDATAAQLVAGPAPGNYVRSGAAGGLHSNCHFDSALEHRALAPNWNQVRLNISCPAS
jgi:hypothetical protein